ncbi:MAG: metallopeptidase family protein [Gemmataceae bacterium]
MKRIGMKTFGRIVARVMQTLPEAFVPYLDNVVVDVEPEPDYDTLKGLGLTDEEIDGGESLFGLFVPMDIPADDLSHAEEVPHRLIIYKRPLEEEFPDRRQFLTEVRKTVIHELAHHFGWTDEELERFDDTPDPFGDGLVEELEALMDADRRSRG